ncbi:hypothetical protein BC826DRAFT_1075811 [Russula brevipes]|nr:hypothetical protein BC826DRAFT_1075811 [Russula brevipes]
MIPSNLQTPTLFPIPSLTLVSPTTWSMCPRPHKDSSQKTVDPRIDRLLRLPCGTNGSVLACGS